MNEKKPNKTHEDEGELSFEDKVLTMLSDLQHYTVKFRETADNMNGVIRDFRTSIHGEDIDEA
jgi:hypothetical protein